MDTAAERRRELGGFLRKRRAQLARAEFGLPRIGRTRETGLRREEVAYHAGVSVTWYTWLEQGRDINPSRQVLEAICRTLRLDDAGHAYVLGLGGYAPEPPEPAGTMNTGSSIPPHLQRFLDAQGAAPAFAILPDWHIAGWNRAYEALYPKVATLEPADRNLLLVIFTDPVVRAMLPDWEVTSGHFLAEYRAEAGAALGRPEHTMLVTRLLEASPEFARAWNEHHVERFASRERRFLHPVAGELVFEHHRLSPSDLPEVHVVVYLPASEETRAKMAGMLTEGPGAEP